MRQEEMPLLRHTRNLQRKQLNRATGLPERPGLGLAALPAPLVRTQEAARPEKREKRIPGSDIQLSQSAKHQRVELPVTLSVVGLLHRDVGKTQQRNDVSQEGGFAG